MTAPSIRLLQLHSHLEGLKNKGSTAMDELYAAKHSMLPLIPHLELEQSRHPQLPSKKRFSLNFQPQSRALVGAISNNTVVGAVAMVMLFGSLVTSQLVFPKTNTVSNAHALSQSTSSSVAVVAPTNDPLGLRQEYMKKSQERGYGEVLFEKIDMSKSLTLSTDSGDILLGGSEGVQHVDYTHTPGEKGHSFFLTNNQEIKAKLDALVPGSRSAISIGDPKKSTINYKYIFVSTNTYQQGDQEIITQTQKSILDIAVQEEDGSVVSYLFRLVGLDK